MLCDTDGKIIDFDFLDEHEKGMVPTDEEREICGILDYSFDKERVCLGALTMSYRPT